MRDDSANCGDRRAVAAGRFYSASPEVLLTDIKALFSKVSGQKEYQGVRAIISPHAGYLFSGIVAASAFASVPPQKNFSNIFIIGSSHRAAFKGASVYGEGDFLTPLGRVPVNREIAIALRKESEFFRYGTEMHDEEHSIEVQLPFIQYMFGNNIPVVPVLTGTGDLPVIKALASSLKSWFTPDNLFIISTDFSHYPSYNDARATDRATARAILSGNPDELTKALGKLGETYIKGLSTGMCGWAAGLVLMYLTSGEKSLVYHHLLYRNSGDSQYGDRESVVGYHSFVIVDEAVSGNHSAMEDGVNLETDKKLTDNSSLSVESGSCGDELKSGKYREVENEDEDENENENENENNDTMGDSFRFTDTDRRTLFRIARASILSGLEMGSGYRVGYSEGSDEIRKSGGVFVTLYLNGELRGCVGKVFSSEPVCNNVAEMAFSAAFSDPRFPALTAREYSLTAIEISVLSPLRRIYKKEEIIIGKHGLYIRKEGRSGVLLPQVASERGWTVEQFLRHTAGNKAGIGQDGWKDAELSVFETLILKEN